MANCLLALGSNLGDRRQHLSRAVRQLSQHTAIELLAVSRFHETQPAGGPGQQESFLNGAALIETSLSAEQLLRATQAVETLLGRTRDVHWGPRSIDVDLLIYDDLVCRSEHLAIPHPWMVARRFVVEPAAEIAPQMVHPELGWTLERLQRHLREMPNRMAVEGIAGLELGRRIVQPVRASLIADPVSPDPVSPDPVSPGAVSPGAGDPASMLDCSQQIELAERRCQCLSASHWCQRDACAISEFWFTESAVAARATLQGAQLARFEERLMQLVATLPVPKLLVLCPAKTTVMTRPCYGWSDLRDNLRGQDEYPWMEIPVTTDARLIDEISAAFQSMQ